MYQANKNIIVIVKYNKITTHIYFQFFITSK